MSRCIAFLRGVSPQNARMPQLQRAFECAGFDAVRTLLSSGNVAFDAPDWPEREIERAAEAAMQAVLGRSFLTIVRPCTGLQRLLVQDPFSAFVVPPQAKRVVSFLRESPAPSLRLPDQADGAQIFAVLGREVYTAYVPNPKGPVFMGLIERSFGTQVTTRTWDTVRKCAEA